MIVLQPLRTRRVCVRPRELTIGEAIAICKLPGHRHELVASEFLRRIADGATAPTAGYVTDPRFWTVQERALLVCHYLAQVSGTDPDISVGESGRLSDYVVFDSDLKVDSVDVGEVAGKRRVVSPMLGAHAEILERLCQSRGDWIIGAMACQISSEDDAPVDITTMGDVQLLGYVQDRMEAVRSLPESDFEALLGAYSMAASRELNHFFAINFDDGGAVFEPQTDREAGPQNPARFLAISCVSGAARRLFGGPDSASR